MMRFVLLFATLAASLIASLPASALQPALTRTFVSSSGVDTNPCTVAAPCATFAQAYSVVAPNGIVAALDPGKYGSLIIKGPVTIDGNGWAAITAPANENGIEIQAGSSDNVILRGITVDGGGGSGINGIEFDSGASLTVTGCTLRNLPDGSGLFFWITGSSAATLTVADSQFINNGDGVAVAVGMQGTTITASFVRTEFVGNSVNGLGLFSNGSGSISATVTDSVTANNGTKGFQVISEATGSMNLSLSNDQISGNAIGIMVTGNGYPAEVWLAQSAVAANSTAAFGLTAGAVINSYGNNYFADNGNNNSTTGLTAVGTQ